NGVFSRSEFLNLVRQRFADHVVGIKREHPWACDEGEAEIALSGKAVKGPAHDLGLGKAPNHLQCSVTAATVDHQYPPNPRQRRQRPADIVLLVVGQNYCRDLVNETHWTRSHPYGSTPAGHGCSGKDRPIAASWLALRTPARQIAWLGGPSRV